MLDVWNRGGAKQERETEQGVDRRVNDIKEWCHTDVYKHSTSWCRIYQNEGELSLTKKVLIERLNIKNNTYSIE